MKFIDRPIFKSHISKDDVSAKERWLGYLLGPAGALLLNEIVSCIPFLRWCVLGLKKKR